MEISKLVILLVIDGLSVKAPERLDLANLKALMAGGCSYRECYFPPTAHPRDWFHTCSLGNVAMATGTVLFRRDQRQIQESFPDGRVTVHVAGAPDYWSISRGYDFVEIGLHSDDEVMERAIGYLDEPRLAFMRVHLQNPGSAGYEVSLRTGAGRNIWAADSPYVEKTRHADELLGELVAALKGRGLWDRTVLIVCGDHGQADTGWHPPYDVDSWRSPLVVAGPGVPKGEVFDYAEVTDLAPTIARLAGVEPPPDAIGRVLPPEGPAAGRREALRELDLAIKRFADLRSRVLEAIARIGERPGRSAERAAKAREIVERADAQFYSLERLLAWRDAGTVDGLIEADRRAYVILRGAADLLGLPRAQAEGPGAE